MLRHLPHLALASAVTTLAACGSMPQQIDGTGDNAVRSIGLDLDNVQQIAADMTEQILNDGFLEGYDHPVPLTVSRFDNKTNLAGFPKEKVLVSVRNRLRQSGKVKVVSTYGEDVVDRTSFDTQDLADDPFFDRSQVPQQGQGTVARLSLIAQLLYLGQQAGRDEQRNYSLRMLVTDVATGDVVFEGISDDISKKQTRGLFGP